MYMSKMKSIVLIFVGIALITCAQGIDVCDSDGSNLVRYCPPDDAPDHYECCNYFRDACCTPEENERLKTIFIVVIVVSVLSFIGLVACVVGIIVCCVCAASPTRSRRTVVTTTPYAPMGPNVVVANTSTNTISKPI